MARRDILNGAKIREIRKKKKRILYAKIYLGVFAFSALLIGLVFLSRSQKLLINKINISGNSAVPTDDIRLLVEQKLSSYYFFVIPKRDVFFYPKKEIEQVIMENFQRISGVKIKINNLKEITITIAEREGKYLWCHPSSSDPSQAVKCYFADSAGYIFAEAPDFSGSAYLKFLGGIKYEEEPIGNLIFPKEEFKRLLNFYDSVTATISPIKLTALEINENGDYKFSLEGTGGKIIFKKDNDFEKILENLNGAVSTEPLKADLAQKLPSLLYLDLRFDNKVYYKFTP